MKKWHPTALPRWGARTALLLPLAATALLVAACGNPYPEPDLTDACEPRPGLSPGITATFVANESAGVTKEELAAGVIGSISTIEEETWRLQTNDGRHATFQMEGSSLDLIMYNAFRLGEVRAVYRQDPESEPSLMLLDPGGNESLLLWFGAEMDASIAGWTVSSPRDTDTCDEGWPNDRDSGGTDSTYCFWHEACFSKPVTVTAPGEEPLRLMSGMQGPTGGYDVVVRATYSGVGDAGAAEEGVADDRQRYTISRSDLFDLTKLIVWIGDGPISR